MKKVIQIGAVLFGMILSSDVQGGQCGNGGCGQPAPACGQQAPACGPADQATNDCWCKYVHYEPNYYCTPRCVQEPVTNYKQCVKYNTKTYDVQRCRYVPEYYTETYEYQEPEYYQVPYTTYKTRTEYDQHVEYVPSYYWKHSCGDNSGTPCAPACGAPACAPACGR